LGKDLCGRECQCASKRAGYKVLRVVGFHRLTAFGLYSMLPIRRECAASPNDERDPPPATTATTEPRGPRRLDRRNGSLIQLENRLKPKSGLRRLCRSTQTRTFEPEMS
jgi:hypothetical protein